MQTKNFGWFPSPPDRRDYNEHTLNIGIMSGWLGPVRDNNRVGVQYRARIQEATIDEIPRKKSLRSKFNSVKDQGQLGACTAFPAAAIVEYLGRTVYGVSLDLSERFIYYEDRRLLGLTGDTGATNRSAMACVRLFGAPAEKFWPYSVADFDVEPGARIYALAKNNNALTYFRHDADPNALKGCYAISVRKWIAAGIPATAGFYVFDSYQDGEVSGDIPFPGPDEEAFAGHAICLMGYDDERVITNRETGAQTTGAFQFRNSWGKSWGDKGYGWIPYQYVINGYMLDMWSALTADVVNVSEFGL